MSKLTAFKKGETMLLMGNEAIARGALEAGVAVVAGYPGTPSSEIVQSLAEAAQDSDLYVEWSANEKVALEVAAAGSFAGLRSLAVMKQNGVNVASDFLLHLAGSGTRGGMVLVACDDPGALSSVNEGESRHFARMVEVPLLEPGSFQEAKDMLCWAFELSEKLQTLVMVRSVTRLSHASGSVTMGDLPGGRPSAFFKHDGSILDQNEGAVISAPVTYKHGLQQERISKATALFEESPFNTYTGPVEPELLVITSSACTLYSMEAIRILGLEGRAGLLKLGTTWPLPSGLICKCMEKTGQVLVVEEVISFIEEQIMSLASQRAAEIGIKTFHGKTDGTIPSIGELNVDLVMAALVGIMDLELPTRPKDYAKRSGEMAFLHAPGRDLTFCPGCPHRASYWSIHNALALDNRQGFVCGDIGCYSMAMLPGGFSTLKTLHSMGSGTGVASGFGKLGCFGMDQPVLSVCGDSTFFHAAMPALVNAVHNQSDLTMILLDNSGTGMTGFQPHPGLPVDAAGQQAPAVDLEAVCRAMGAEVIVCDPFDLEATQNTLLDLLDQGGGVRVLVLRQICALSPEKKGKKQYNMDVDEAVCIGESCGCNRLCTRVFKCPGLYWDNEQKVSRIDEVICAGCGVCASVCPAGAISRKEQA